jgi:NitT/TauT family transport system permease protein
MSGEPSAKKGSALMQARRRSVTRSLLKAGAGLLLLLLVGVAWEVFIRWRDVPSYTAPAPSAILAGLKDNWGAVWSNMETTAMEAIAGLAVGTVLACLIALGFLYLPPLRTAFMPMAIALSTVPIVAIAPILILIFGQGILSKVVMTSMICFFPTLMNLGRGLEAVDQDVLDLFRVHNATRRQLLMKVRVPTARPYFFAALRVTSTASVIGAIVAEWINAERGLGFMIIQETFNFDAVLLWGAMLVAIALATTFFSVVVVLDYLSSRYIVR